MEIARKILIIACVVVFVVVLSFLIYTIVQSFKASDVDIAELANTTYMTEEMNTTLRIMNNGRALLINDGAVIMMKLLESDKNIFKYTSDEYGEILILFMEDAVYCDVLREYLYFVR